MKKSKPTPLAISTGSELHKFPPKCRKEDHEFVYSYSKFTTMTDNDTVVDTFFGPVCIRCKEIQRQ